MVSRPQAYPRTGAAASSLPSSFGIRTTPPYTHSTMPTIASPRKKAIGASRASSSCGRCSTPLGTGVPDLFARTTLPTSRFTSVLLKMKPVCSGTISTTTIPRRRLDMWASRTRVPPATLTLCFSHCILQMLSERYSSSPTRLLSLSTAAACGGTTVGVEDLC